MSVNYIMISPGGLKNRQRHVNISLKCKDSFVCVCPERRSPRLRGKEGVMRLGTDQTYAGWI